MEGGGCAIGARHAWCARQIGGSPEKGEDFEPHNPYAAIAICRNDGPFPGADWTHKRTTESLRSLRLFGLKQALGLAEGPALSTYCSLDTRLSCQAKSELLQFILHLVSPRAIRKPAAPVLSNPSPV